MKAFYQLKREGGWNGGTVKAWSGGDITGAFGMNAVTIKEGADIRIRWPNGVRQSITVAHKEERGSDGDHGHSYAWNKAIPGFNHDVNGVEIWISLETRGLLTELPVELAEP